MDAMLNRLDRSLREAQRAAFSGDAEKLYISIRNAVVHATAFRCAVMCQGGSTRDADAMLRQYTDRLRTYEQAFLKGAGIAADPLGALAVRRVMSRSRRGSRRGLGEGVSGLNPVLLARVERSLNVAREALEWKDCRRAYGAVIDGAANLAALITTAAFSGSLSPRQASEAADAHFRAHKLLAESFYEQCVQGGGVDVEFEFPAQQNAMTWMNGLGRCRC